MVSGIVITRYTPANQVPKRIKEAEAGFRSLTEATAGTAKRLFRNMLRINNLFEWRMGRDSNPRYLAVHTLSRRAQSTALAPIQQARLILLPLESSFNLFSIGDPGCGNSVGNLTNPSI